MRPLAALALLLLLTPSVRAQAPEASTAAADAMEHIRWLAGDWEGEGWISRGPDERHAFVQTERVRPLLGGEVLLIEGRGVAAEDPSLVVHDAVAVIGYDASDERYAMRSFLAGGRTAAATARIDGGAFVWSPGNPDIRYTIRQGEDGRWHEVGEITRDGGDSWYTFLEMTLERAD